MKRKIFAITLLFVMGISETFAFCGFYVAKADAKLFNKSSQVILVRDGNNTVITMSNDFQGPVKDFAMVVPVPVVLEEKNIRVVDQAIFTSLDAYSGPRLVEYFDQNPCYVEYEYSDNRRMKTMSAFSGGSDRSEMATSAKKQGVTIEAKYTIGEYDILILSAKESTGLKDWLIENGYKIPETANEVLEPYIKSNMKFFVVKVNLEKQEALGFNALRPIQIEFDSPKFMLPIRLGMANASGDDQDLIIYSLTKTGRTECTNYRTVKIPTDRNVPLDVRKKFGEFYVSLFNKHYKYQGQNAVFLEYAWNVSPSWGGMKCDPCVGPPPLTADLGKAGVKWLNANGQGNVFFTRLHVRYSRAHFPQDLQFQETPNTEQFQGRYILTNPASGDFSCDGGQDYLKALALRRKLEVEELAVLTGWDIVPYQAYIDQYNHLIKDSDFKKNNLTPVVPTDDDGYGNEPGYGNRIWFTIGFGFLILALFTYLNRLPVTPKPD
jgi:hypothetical protein